MPASESESAPQWMLVPLHRSRASHAPTGMRHGVIIANTASPRQAEALPLHRSALSQTPAAGRQTTVVPDKASAGHVAVLPVQFSQHAIEQCARHAMTALPLLDGDIGDQRRHESDHHTRIDPVEKMGCPARHKFEDARPASV